MTGRAQKNFYKENLKFVKWNKKENKSLSELYFHFKSQTALIFQKRRVGGGGEECNQRQYFIYKKIFY